MLHQRDKTRLKCKSIDWLILIKTTTNWIVKRFTILECKKKKKKIYNPCYSSFRLKKTTETHTLLISVASNSVWSDVHVCGLQVMKIST